METTIIHNDQVRRALIGTPERHQHIRLVLEVEQGQTIVLPEAVLAAAVRAFVTLKTHPQLEALELRTKILGERKQDFAPHQLIEEKRNPTEVRKEIAGLIDE